MLHDGLPGELEQWRSPPAHEFHAKKNAKYLIQFYTPGAVRTPASFKEMRFLRPVKGMLAQVPTLDTMFTDAPDASVRFKTVADLLDFEGAEYHKASVEVTGSREEMDTSWWEIPL